MTTVIRDIQLFAQKTFTSCPYMNDTVQDTMFKNNKTDMLQEVPNQTKEEYQQQCQSHLISTQQNGNREEGPLIRVCQRLLLHHN